MVQKAAADNRRGIYMSGIGYKTLARFLQNHPEAGLTVEVGNRTLVKREKFGRYIDEVMEVL